MRGAPATGNEGTGPTSLRAAHPRPWCAHSDAMWPRESSHAALAPRRNERDRVGCADGLFAGRRCIAVQWDLGLAGVGLLVAMSLGFGVIAHLVVLVLRRATTPLLWAIAATTYFVAGIFISEVWFGWATAAELQPNIDGLSFDEVLLIGLIPGVAAVLLTQYLTMANRRRQRSAQT